MAHIVGLCGIDGAGKTTVAKLVVERLQCEGLRARYRHELNFPGVRAMMRVVQLVLGRRRTMAARERVITSTNRNRPLVSLAYHLLIWVDSLVSFAWFKMVPGVVIHDRWPFDYLVHFRLRGYRNRFIHTLFKRFPRPDTLILLSLHSEVAFERKRSDPTHTGDGPEFFENLARLTDELAAIVRYDLVISAEPPAVVVVNEVLDAIARRSGSAG